MTKTQLILSLLLFPLVTFSQNADEEWKEASPESKAYHESRMRNTIPPYGLAKIKEILSKTTYEEEGKVMPPKDYAALSLREKFTYHMIQAESYSQNCDVMPPIQEEHKKIFGQLPDAFDEENWSTRQIAFLKENKDSVLALIKESVTRSKKVGLNYKHAIVEVNGTAMIPFLIETFNRDHKDLDILTVLMLLMKNNKYPPFMSSLSYEKLYGPKADYQHFLQFNKANEELIIKRASDFYNSAR